VTLFVGAGSQHEFSLDREKVIVADAVTATFEFGFKSTELRIERAGPLLYVVVADSYTGDDAGADVVNNYAFSAISADEIPSGDFAVIAKSPIFADLVETGAITFVPELIEIVPVFPFVTEG
jgi:hypothetical protein